MDQQLLRSLGIEGDLDVDSSTTKGGPGKSTLTSKLTPAPQVVFRVADPATARALGESFGSGSRPRIQREADGASGGRDGNGVMAGAEAAVDRAASSSGAPLPTHIQRQFEGSLGADLSSVRVHTGGESQEAAHAVGAKAYTVGNDIHFAAGRYQPDDPFGMHLLAHEVAHTVQQSGGAQRRQNKLEVSTPQDSAEHEADRAADAMVAGLPAQVSTAGSAVARVKIKGPNGEEIDMNDPHTDPDKEWKDQYKAWDQGDQNSMIATLKPVDYVAAAGTTELPGTPMPAASILVEHMPASQSQRMDKNPFFDQRLQDKFGNEPLLEKREPSPELVGSWNAYSAVCNAVEGLWGACRAPLDSYLVADKDTAHELQEALGLEIRSASKKSINQQVDEAHGGAAGFKVGGAELRHLSDTGKSPVVKAQLDVVAGHRNKLDGCLGGMREGMGALKKAAAAKELSEVSAQIDSLKVEKGQQEEALKSAKGLSSELKSTISTIISVATAAAEAWGGKPDKLVGMAADFVYEKALSAVYAKDVEAATKKLNATNGKLESLSKALPGLTARLVTGGIEEALGKVQKARGELRAELIEYRKAHDKLAEVVEKHYAGQSSSSAPKKGPFAEDKQSRDTSKDPTEDKKMAAAIRAIPRVTKVLALADACNGPLGSGIPSSGPAQKGYALAAANGFHSAAQLRTVIGWMAGGKQRLGNDTAQWKGRQAQLEAMMNALEHKE